MKSILNWIKNKPTRAAAILTALIGLASLVLPVGVTAGLVGLVSAILGKPLYDSVSPISNVVRVATEAANGAAKATASILTPSSIGETGEIADSAVNTVTDVATTAATEALKGIGITRKNRTYKLP